jgi:ATP/ADP translocase
MWRRLGVQRAERGLFVWGAATLFLLGWADVSIKNVSETLFVKRVGVEVMPLAILVSSLVLVATTGLLARRAARTDRTRLLARLLVVLATGLLPLWLLVRSGNAPGTEAGAATLFIASKELQSLGVLAFVLALGDLVHPRQAKRLVAPLLAAMTLGAILGSFASKPLAELLGVAGVVPFSTAMLLASGACALPLRRIRAPRLDRGTRARRASVAERPADGDDSLLRLWRGSRLFRLLAGVTLANALLGPMLYYQFNYVADLATAGQDAEARLLAIYASLRGWISVGILGIQLGLASRLFRRIGLPLSTALSPIVYLLGFVGLSVQLSLTAGVAAMAGTRLVDSAVYDPALRVLYSLFQEKLRPRASALLEGPIKRGGGALGAAATQAAIWLGGAGGVGVLALPIAAAWCGLAAALWRSYPALLMQAASARGLRGERLPVRELLDRATGRALSRQLASSDPAECRAAIELCREADPERAIASLARAARHAPDSTRPLLVESLDRLLERAIADPVANHTAAQDLAALLAQPGRTSGLDRANVVQAFGRLGAGGGGTYRALLEREQVDPHPAVRLAATAALARQGGGAQGRELEQELAAAAVGSDSDTRQIAREELRALLVRGEPERDGAAWHGRLALLASLLVRSEDRVGAAEALADVARRHGAHAAGARDVLLPLWDDPDPRVRAAVVRFAGHAGLQDQARRIVGRLDAGEPALAEAAEEALLALGSAATDVLLVELAFGRRSRREGVFRLLRELEVEEKSLRALFERELDAVRRALVQRSALAGNASPILIQRLEERIEEGIHTALQILAALRGHDALAELAGQIQLAHDVRRRAILLEALEALLEPGEREALLPLLEDRPLEERAAEAARRLGTPIPPADLALQNLLDDTDEMTRRLARATGGPLARGAAVWDHAAVLDPVEIALYLKKTPLFEGLSTRHLLDLAAMVREERHPAGAVLMREEEFGTSLYLIVEGRVRITRGERRVAEIAEEAFLGEVGLLEGARRTATATTLTPVRVLRLERDDLLALMEEIPAIAIRVAQELSRRYRQVMDQMAE